MFLRAGFRPLVILSVLLVAVPTSAGSAAAGGERVDVFVGFTKRPGPNEQAFVRRHGGVIKYTYSLVGAIAANIPAEAAARMSRDRNVTHVEPDIAVSAVGHSTEVSNTWGVDRIEADLVHHDAVTGAGVKVGVIDSGIDTDHTDLAWDPNCSYNFVAGTATPEDGDGHGTHTAGTVAALMNGKMVVGAAPGATLCIYKVLNDSGSGSYSDVVKALERAVSDGVNVTNNSYGSTGNPGTTVKQAFDNAYAKGVLHAAAAGNEGNPPGIGSNCIYPALWDSLIATAATTKSDSRASFSSTCSALELAAPGSQVNSTTNDGKTGTFSGTSMASPHVAGTAALVGSANPLLSNAEIRQVLQLTAQDLGPTGRDQYYGYGLVRADLAVAAAGGGGGGGTTTGSVSGVVTDASTNAAIGGATVSVDTGQSAATSSNGSYTISDVPTGDRSVMASASGYSSQTKDATVSEDDTTPVDFALDPSTTGSGTAHVDAITYSTDGGRLQDKHLNVRVSVVDGDGNPVGGATVSIDLFRDGSRVVSGSGTTGSDGAVVFSLKNADPGCYETIVTNVSASGLTWDGTTPTNGHCK